MGIEIPDRSRLFGQCSLEWLYERLGRKRLGEKGEASGLKRSSEAEVEIVRRCLRGTPVLTAQNARD